jgi:organic radical activating enzyme
MKGGFVDRSANRQPEEEPLSSPVPLNQDGKSAACTPSGSCHPNCGVAPIRSQDSDDRNDIALLHGLDFLWLELTSKCNLQCVHCYAESSPKAPLIQQMTSADWLRMLREASAAGCRNVQFIGGEPTTYPKLSELIGEARTLKYDYVEVFTNGTMFTDRIKHAFIAHKVNLAFSVYAETALIHDAITLHRGSFEKTMANIKWALTQGLKVRAAIIKMTENASEIEKTRAFLQDFGINEIQVDRLRGVGRGAMGKEICSPEDELCGRCWEGKLCITAEGKMFPCIFARFQQVGTVHNGIKSAIEGKPLCDFRSGLRSKAVPGCEGAHNIHAL